MISCNYSSLYLTGSTEGLNDKHRFIFSGPPQHEVISMERRVARGLAFDYNLTSKGPLMKPGNDQIVNNETTLWEKINQFRLNHEDALFFGGFALSSTVLGICSWVNETVNEGERFERDAGRGLLGVAGVGLLYYLSDYLPKYYENLADSFFNRQWKVIQLEKVDMPKKQISASGCFIDPLTSQVIPREEIDSPSVIKIGNLIYRCTSVLQAILTKDVADIKGEIPHPQEERSMTAQEKSDFLNHISLISGYAVSLLEACWNNESTELAGFATSFFQDMKQSRYPIFRRLSKADQEDLNRNLSKYFIEWRSRERFALLLYSQKVFALVPPDEEDKNQ